MRNARLMTPRLTGFFSAKFLVAALGATVLGSTAFSAQTARSDKARDLKSPMTETTSRKLAIRAAADAEIMKLTEKRIVGITQYLDQLPNLSAEEKKRLLSELTYEKMPAFSREGDILTARLKDVNVKFDLSRMPEHILVIDGITWIYKPAKPASDQIALLQKKLHLARPNEFAATGLIDQPLKAASLDMPGVFVADAAGLTEEAVEKLVEKKLEERMKKDGSKGKLRNFLLGAGALFAMKTLDASWPDINEGIRGIACSTIYGAKYDDIPPTNYCFKWADALRTWKAKTNVTTQATGELLNTRNPVIKKFFSKPASCFENSSQYRAFIRSREQENVWRYVVADFKKDDQKGLVLNGMKEYTPDTRPDFQESTPVGFSKPKEKVSEKEATPQADCPANEAGEIVTCTVVDPDYEYHKTLDPKAFKTFELKLDSKDQSGCENQKIENCGKLAQLYKDMETYVKIATIVCSGAKEMNQEEATNGKKPPVPTDITPSQAADPKTTKPAVVAPESSSAVQ